MLDWPLGEFAFSSVVTIGCRFVCSGWHWGEGRVFFAAHVRQEGGSGGHLLLTSGRLRYHVGMAEPGLPGPHQIRASWRCIELWGGRYLGPGQVCGLTLPLTNTARGGAQFVHSPSLTRVRWILVRMGSVCSRLRSPIFSSVAVPCQDCPQSLPSGCRMRAGAIKHSVCALGL